MLSSVSALLSCPLTPQGKLKFSSICRHHQYSNVWPSGATLQQPLMRAGITKLLHVSCEEQRLENPEEPAAARGDVPEAAAWGAHQGGAGVCDRHHVSTETIGAGRRRGATSLLLFQSRPDRRVESKHTINISTPTTESDTAPSISGCVVLFDVFSSLLLQLTVETSTTSGYFQHSRNFTTHFPSCLLHLLTVNFCLWFKGQC